MRLRGYFATPASLCHFHFQPGFRVSSVVVGGRNRDAQCAGRFFQSQPCEETQTDQLCLAVILRFELLECLIEIQKVDRLPVSLSCNARQLDPLELAASSQTFPAPRALNENSLHGPSRRAKKVPSTVLVDVHCRTNQTYPGLVDQSRRLNRLPWFLP